MSGKMALLRVPLFWGGLVFIGFYALIDQGVLRGGLIERYFASHPVEYISTGLFFVGIAALAIKTVQLVVQFAALRRIALRPVPPGGEPVESAVFHLEDLAGLPAGYREGYLVRRLEQALEFVRRKGSASKLDEQIRYLAEADIEQMHGSYALVRIIVWAIPILGFLGTVIGITLAIANLSPDQLERSLPEVTGGLGVAFDTTALALALSILLMFAKFGTERLEERLLALVDARTAGELVGRFPDDSLAGDPQLARVSRIAETVLDTSQQVVERQAQLWKSTVDAAHERWSELTGAAGEQLTRALSAALATSLERHAQVLCAAEGSMAEANRRHWQRVHDALQQSAQQAVVQQQQLVQQGELLRQVVEATGQIRHLEKALNDNLGALAGSKHFEETVVSLAAAIQLLTAHLSAEPLQGRRVRLTGGGAASSAA